MGGSACDLCCHCPGKRCLQGLGSLHQGSVLVPEYCVALGDVEVVAGHGFVTVGAPLHHGLHHTPTLKGRSICPVLSTELHHNIAEPLSRMNEAHLASAGIPQVYPTSLASADDSLKNFMLNSVYKPEQFAAKEFGLPHYPYVYLQQALSQSVGRSGLTGLNPFMLNQELLRVRAAAGAFHDAGNFRLMGVDSEEDSDGEEVAFQAPPREYKCKDFKGDQKAKKKSDHSTHGRWTNHEHEMFVAALQVHGKKWKKVASMIKTRTAVQIRTHAQKYFIKMNKKDGEEEEDEEEDEADGEDVVKEEGKGRTESISEITTFASSSSSTSSSSSVPLKATEPSGCEEDANHLPSLPPLSMYLTERETAPTTVPKVLSDSVDVHMGSSALEEEWSQRRQKETERERSAPAPMGMGKGMTCRPSSEALFEAAELLFSMSAGADTPVSDPATPGPLASASSPAIPSHSSISMPPLPFMQGAAPLLQAQAQALVAPQGRKRKASEAGVAGEGLRTMPLPYPMGGMGGEWSALGCQQAAMVQYYTALASAQAQAQAQGGFPMWGAAAMPAMPGAHVQAASAQGLGLGGGLDLPGLPGMGLYGSLPYGFPFRAAARSSSEADSSEGSLGSGSGYMNAQGGHGGQGLAHGLDRSGGCS
eukprot:CAMPEP_0173175668 /NCGR_PEP_ID=MMETSP1141-20130122/4039_1 /TAXON_ID=483371 /ORGANISM="non described non described, Strain CCMP2298" /LENGTH=646 /DNA_ID=CAMNT_0014097935 /DNA_START=581 /DNA_END=2518 /DNA_ORIENTATION=+